jgi:thiosulfate sulfurtransferase
MPDLIMFKRISATDAHALLLTGNAQIVDIRDEMSYQNAHVEGALNLNNTNLQSFIESADPDRPLLVYCYHGISSQSAAEFLSQKGFEEVYSIDGGFDACNGLFAISSGNS